MRYLANRSMQFPFHVPKGWGHELWLANKPAYCGKLLVVKKGKQCSWHYHKLKDETFYLQSGKILLTYGMDDSMVSSKQRVLEPGMCIHIPPGLRHRFFGQEDSVIIEISTKHFEEDSIRVIKGD